MAERGRYRTRQGALVEECLRQHADGYLTVDGVIAALASTGEHVGRSTAYRHLEALVADGAALKAVSTDGERSYRLAPEGSVGQLVCLDCGRALPLDCHMLEEFTSHVRAHHGFVIESSRNVLYGHCAECSGKASHE